ncbi:methyl-accepting chemotaxis protein [Roseomonas sp. CECT 9278]|uniref:methyl-accepting chemotaxis protein n=1 Tax=Roseomonas sp. CECT 9278 TaxID=2845823 RepID=UPI001E466BB8|nr:methyl-accepting chemotaxis protein [Roseomonas sp. CECT 9278]CAH0243931.1 hypothetical protein ROS9278_02964 [Roseomonas sp. CECT 9278]
MDGSLEAIEAVRSTREAANRTHRWRFGEWLGRINTRAAMISVLFLVVIGLFASNALTTLSRQSLVIEDLAGYRRTADETIEALESSVAAYGTALAGIVAGSVPPNAIAARMVAQAARLSAAFLAVEHALAPELDPAALATARDALARLPALAERTQQTLGARRRGDPAAIHDEWVNAQDGFSRLVASYRDQSSKRIEASLAAARRIESDARAVTFAAIGLGIAATILVWVIVVAMITRPIGNLAQSMVRVARGDVAAAVPLTDREDQLGIMARAVLVFRETLNVTRSLAARALEGATQTSTSLTQAATAMDRVASNVAAQRDDLRGLTESLDKTVESFRRVGDTAQQARDRAGDAKLLLDDTLRKLRCLKPPERDGAHDRDHVNRVTAAIVRMATQANTLAANAAQEALRTGADSGVAAIAEEARRLSAGSATLAIEIAEAIDMLGSKGRAGDEAAEAIAASSDRLEGLVTDTARLAVTIAEGMMQQRETLRRLGEQIDQVAASGQSNATAARDLAASMADLKRHAAETRVAVDSVAAGAQLGRNA